MLRQTHLEWTPKSSADQMTTPVSGNGPVARRIREAFATSGASMAIRCGFDVIGIDYSIANRAVEGTILALVTAVVARPVAVALSLGTARYSLPERGLLGWAGLRGAVPVVLATFPIIEDVPKALEFFNIAFFAVLISTLLQGSTFEHFARRLRALARTRETAVRLALGASRRQLSPRPTDSCSSLPVKICSRTR